MNNIQDNIKIGLALGGGGSRGSYQIGILKALYEEKILKQVESITGTSIGAVNTLMVMANFDYEKMIETWEKISNSEIYGKGMDRLKEDGHGLYNIHKLFEVLSKEVSLSEVRKSRFESHVVATKIRKGRLIDQLLFRRFEKEVFNLQEVDDPRKAVLASSSIPILFGSTEVDGEQYIDGGVMDNCPVEPLIEQGCNIIFAVPIHLRFSPNKLKDKDVFIINMKTNYLFNKISFDPINFKPEVVREKAEYGYMMGKHIVNQLRSSGYLDENNHWQIPKEYTHFRISRAEEQKLRKSIKEER